MGKSLNIFICLGIIITSSFFVSGCNDEIKETQSDYSKEEEISQEEKTVAKEIRIEAESGKLSGTRVENRVSGFSGEGYVTGFENEDDSVEITVNSEVHALYDLYIRYRSPHGKKVMYLKLNSQGAGMVELSGSEVFVETYASPVKLKRGENRIKVVSGWGWYDIDSFRLVPSIPRGEHKVENSLVNPNASEQAKELMEYLVSQYGHGIISGQTDVHHVQWIKSMTGKEPALVAFDMMDYSPSRVEYGATSNTVQEAIQWGKRGGIVSFHWHWNAPMDLIDEPGGKEWYKGFMSNATTFDIEKALNDPDSVEYEKIIRDIDAISEELKKLRDENIPVLWRPLHEAGGRWFWWGSKGPDPCLKLYDLMYERMTDFHNLNNLIWVWSTPEEDWYPGNNKVDIIGYDSYPPGRDYSSIINMYDHLVRLTQNKKLIALTENGSIPDPGDLIAYEARWSWFSTWAYFVRDTDYNELSHIKYVYNHDYVITLEELPWNKK